MRQLQWRHNGLDESDHVGVQRVTDNASLSLECNSAISSSLEKMASLPANFNQAKKGRQSNPADKPTPRPFIKPDYSSIKHPSTIKLISVVKAQQAPLVQDDSCVGLTKGELLPFINHPFWRRLRLFMLVIFALSFFGMLIGAVIIIAMAPSCSDRVLDGLSNSTSSTNNLTLSSDK